MERLNLTKAKEMAKREDWSNKLQQYDQEFEEGAGTSGECQASSEGVEQLKISESPWDLHSAQEEDPELVDPEDLIDKERGEHEGREEMGSLEDLYERAGVMEGKVQEGEISKSAKFTLSSLPGDVRELGDRTIFVDLSYLRSGTERKRTAGIIERVIKNYSPINGLVNTETTGKRGVFKFHVTNEYISPVRTRSPSPKRATSSRSASASIQESPTVLSPIPELENGIIMSPRFKGLPKCVVKYGQHGLTPDLVDKIRLEYPDQGLNQIVKYSLAQTIKGKRVLNMYVLPD